MGFLETLVQGFNSGYQEISLGFSSSFVILLNVFIFAILIAIYSIFTWKFYHSLSKKDILRLNLRKYNKVDHPVFRKTVAFILYILEYIVILPFLIFFWFAVLAFLILVMSENESMNQVIILSAAIVAGIRILSYYAEDLSRELAKIFPLTVLVVFVLDPSFFSLERIITNIAQVPQFLTSILYFLGLTIALELVLRIIDMIINSSKGK